MDRREVLKIGLGAGITLVAERVTGAEAQEPRASKVKTSFFVGTFTGGPASNWQFTVGIAAKRARGGTSGKPVDSSTDTGHRMSGMQSGNKLSLTLYAMADITEITPVGTLTATIKGSSLNGTFALTDGRTGTVTARHVTPSPKIMKQFAGNFNATLSYSTDLDQFPNNHWETGGTAKLSIAAGGTWTVTNIVSATGDTFDKTLFGYWTADTKNNVPATVIPTTPASQAPQPRDGSFGAAFVAFCLWLNDEFGKGKNSGQPCCDDKKKPTPPPPVTTYSYSKSKNGKPVLTMSTTWYGTDSDGNPYTSGTTTMTVPTP